MKILAPMIEPTTIDSMAGNPTVWPTSLRTRLAPYADLTAGGVYFLMYTAFAARLD
jgi:hypothetical protein